jgi:hypothetical protein
MHHDYTNVASQWLMSMFFQLQQWLHSSGYVDVIGFHNVTFNQEKIKNLQDTRFAKIVEGGK